MRELEISSEAGLFDILITKILVIQSNDTKPKKLDLKDCGSKGSQSFECQWGGYNCSKIHLSAQSAISSSDMDTLFI